MAGYSSIQGYIWISDSLKLILHLGPESTSFVWNKIVFTILYSWQTITYKIFFVSKTVLLWSLKHSLFTPVYHKSSTFTTTNRLILSIPWIFRLNIGFCIDYSLNSCTLFPAVFLDIILLTSIYLLSLYCLYDTVGWIIDLEKCVTEYIAKETFNLVYV